MIRTILVEIRRNFGKESSLIPRSLWHRVADLRKNDRYYQIKLNIGGSITVKLTFVLVCLDSAALLMFNEQLYLCGQIQTSTTGGQLYSETSPMVSVLRLFITYGRFHILKLISFWVSEMP